MRPDATSDRPRYIGGIEEESSVGQRLLFVRQTFVLQTESYICGGGGVHKTNGGRAIEQTCASLSRSEWLAHCVRDITLYIFIIIQIDKASVF